MPGSESSSTRTNKPEGNMSRELMKDKLYIRDVWIFRNNNWLQVEKESDWRSCRHNLQTSSNVDTLIIRYSARKRIKVEDEENQPPERTQ